MMTISYWFKQRLWLLLGQSLCLNIEETVGNFMINQEILEHGVVNLKLSNCIVSPVEPLFYYLHKFHKTASYDKALGD